MQYEDTIRSSIECFQNLEKVKVEDLISKIRGDENDN